MLLIVVGFVLVLVLVLVVALVATAGVTTRRRRRRPNGNTITSSYTAAAPAFGVVPSSRSLLVVVGTPTRATAFAGRPSTAGSKSSTRGPRISIFDGETVIIPKAFPSRPLLSGEE